MADQDTPTARRSRLQSCLHRLGDCDDKVALAEAVRDTLAVSPPDGSSDVLDHLAQAYRRQADVVEEVGARVGAVGRTHLPNVWAGQSGAGAADAVNAAARDADHMSLAFREAYRTLAAFADVVHEAQATDGMGRELLFDAFRILESSDALADDQQGDGAGKGGGGLRKGGLSVNRQDSEAAEEALSHARTAATAGAQKRLTAAAKCEEAARVATRDLNKLTSQARAGRLRGSGLSDADALALADTAVAGAPRDLNKLLSADDLDRSEQAMSRLDSDDHAEFNRMLSDAKSPEERAYLLKALAAGNSMDAVSTFQDKIHGRDPLWLRDHLSPITADSDSMKDEGLDDDGANKNTEDVTFHGQKWEQGGDGSEGTCVASSTITARALVDPVYALDLTGGPSGHDENPDHFRDRLVDEQHRVHNEGDGGKNWNGMGVEGQELVDDREIGSHTGTDYDRRDLSGDDDRRAALTDVEQSVADGRPVPVNVSGSDGNHAMMIIGQEGDKLQIYNPWGTTTWVSEHDFVSGHLGGAADSGLGDGVFAVFVPHGTG
ncbi:peptidoglycan-binding protein [Streptomyces sp. NPDC059740]|uniref:peptidoglycan-binding protein n=1 Tax=Streptomyces sp. NPDC059740 TaxID=3346926 RepID=UPI00364C95D1